MSRFYQPGAESSKELQKGCREQVDDQARLQRLHDQLWNDYEEMASEKEELKVSKGALRLDLSQLQERKDSELKKLQRAYEELTKEQPDPCA